MSTMPKVRAGRVSPNAGRRVREEADGQERRDGNREVNHSELRLSLYTKKYILSSTSFSLRYPLFSKCGTVRSRILCIYGKRRKISPKGEKEAEEGKIARQNNFRKMANRNNLASAIFLLWGEAILLLHYKQ